MTTLTKRLDRIRRTGRVWLPRGVYYYEDTLNLTDWGGGVLEGSGMGDGSPGWMQQHVLNGTVLVYQGPKDTPAVKFTGAGCEFRNLAIVHANDGVCVEYRMGRGSRNNAFTNVRFRGGLGFQAGPDRAVASDCVFTGCHFEHCETGFRACNWQQVGWTFLGCHWTNGDTAIDLAGGGVVFVQGCTSDAMRCFGRSTGGGKNNATVMIQGLLFDRSGNGDFDYIIDNRAKEACHRWTVDCLQLTEREPMPGRVLFAAGEHNHRYGAKIEIRGHSDTHREAKWSPEVVPLSEAEAKP